MAKRKLGRGLDALLGGSLEETEQEEGKILSLPLSAIHPNPWQPRRAFDEEGLKNLAASIKEKGVIQPVTVRRAGDGYELAAGERRLRAAQLAGLSEIPALLVSYDDETMAETALIENLQREDLNPMEECGAYHRLMETYGLTQEALAAKVGKSRSYIAGLARLSALPGEIQQLLRDGKLTYAHARILLSLATPAEQLALARKIVDGGLSTRAAEALARGKPAKPAPRRDEALEAHLQSIEQSLALSVGTVVRIHMVGKRHHRGTITLTFKSDEEFERLTKLLGE